MQLTSIILCLACINYFMIKRLDFEDICIYNFFIIHFKYRTVRINEYFTDIKFFETALF